VDEETQRDDEEGAEVQQSRCEQEIRRQPSVPVQESQR
jgi:hypothetical protein